MVEYLILIQGEQDGVPDAAALEQAVPQREDDVPPEAFQGGPPPADLQVEGLLPQQQQSQRGHQGQRSGSRSSSGSPEAAAAGPADSASAGRLPRQHLQRGEAGKYLANECHYIHK